MGDRPGEGGPGWPGQASPQPAEPDVVAGVGVRRPVPEMWVATGEPLALNNA